MNSSSQEIAGYRKKPQSIYLIAGVFAFLPILSLIQASQEIGFSHNLAEVLKSHFFILELFGCWTTALALLSFSKPGFYYFLLLAAYALLSKGYRLTRSSFEDPYEFLVAFIWLSISLFILLTRLRLPYLHPQLRWWAQPPRFQHIAYGKLVCRDLRFPIVTLNLSRGGAFVKLDERLLTRELRASFKDDRRDRQIIFGEPPNLEEERWVLKQLDAYPRRLGEEVHLEMALMPEASQAIKQDRLKLKAEIVWISKDQSPYQYGLGLRFTNYMECVKLKDYLKYFETHPPLRV